jgi:Family of unknown function (DUF5686)/CarboxypepD_reg-like domain
LPLVLAFTQNSTAQTKVIRGRVADSASRIPLENVSITVTNTLYGTLSDAAGHFSLGVNKNAQTIGFSITGYHTKIYRITGEPTQLVEILLSKSYTTLENVTINGRRGKYRNKNNPAVDLIRQVIANKSKNGPMAMAYSSYKSYERTQLFTDSAWIRVSQNFVLKKYRFFFENMDTSVVPGKSLNSIYLQEILSNNYFRKEPEMKKKLIVAQKTVNYGEYVDMKGVSGALHYLYADINIYDNNISAFTMQFVSPISDLGPTFYMYFIRDTTVQNGLKIVELNFTPRNPEDLLLRGSLFVTLDGRYAVQRVELGIPKHANLNYVRNFQLKQHFELGPGGHYYLAESDMRAAFSPFPKSQGFFGERKVSISELSDSALPSQVFLGPAVDTLAMSSERSNEFWGENRPEPLSPSQTKTYTNADSLQKLRSFRTLMDLSTLYFVGYKSAGKFDIGPVRTFYSFNSVEGQRIQFGGRTNYKFSTRFFLDGYLGYGFKDDQFKYKLTASYSLNHRSIYSYPFNYIQASYLHDLKNPGQEDVFSNGNTFLSSFSRGYNSNWLYSDIFRFSYVHEFGNHLSYIVGTEYWRQQPAGSLYYVKEPAPQQLDTIAEITTGELSLAIRWAPNEQFFENKVSRRNIVNKFPVFTLQYSKGINGLFGGEYNYDAIHVHVTKRVFISPLGFSDLRLDAGYLFGTLPFPLLIIPSANRSYFYSALSYNLMNVEEFVVDHYAGLNIDHYFNGFFFNKVPLLKKLRLREVVAAKILYGGLRNENNPNYNPNQMLFPTTNGVPTTFALGAQPYVEASVGIYNIFSFIRLDLVKRFTYLDHPNISTFGLLVSTNFNF